MKKILKMLKENGIKCHLEGNAIVVETSEEGVNMYVWAYISGEREDIFGADIYDWLYEDEEDGKPNKFVICSHGGERLGCAFSFNELISSLKKNLEAF